MPMAAATSIVEDKERWVKKIKEFDGFPKVDETFLETSYYGGLATIGVSVLLVVLLLGNILDYASTVPSHEFLVDHTVSRQV